MYVHARANVYVTQLRFDTIVPRPGQVYNGLNPARSFFAGSCAAAAGAKCTRTPTQNQAAR